MSDVQQTYKNRAQAFRFVREQGLGISERKFYNDAAELGMVQQDKSLRLADLVAYINDQRADAIAADPEDGHRARLVKAQADKMEFENDVKQGKYLNREEEEQRDAAVLAALRRHIEAAAPDRLQNIIAHVSEQVDETTRAKIIAVQPEWLASDMDFLDRMFDQFLGA